MFQQKNWKQTFEPVQLTATRSEVCVSSCKVQRRSGLLKVFRRGPRRNIGGHEVATHVDKPRKEEAAGVLDQAMGKVWRRLWRRMHHRCG